MVCAPRIQRAGWLQDGAIAFEGFDLAGDRRDNAIADLVEDRKVSSNVRLKISAQTILALRVSTSSTVTVSRVPRTRVEPLTT
ncbi:MAG TPA: hypothetical protein VJ260_03600 [Vicinamibacterales bacterium]|nr:hypothetical protein [Vicinamibacterales bacterium]